MKLSVGKLPSEVKTLGALITLGVLSHTWCRKVYMVRTGFFWPSCLYMWCKKYTAAVNRFSIFSIFPCLDRPQSVKFGHRLAVKRF